MADDDKRSNSHSRRNKGISPVLGTIIFVLVAVAMIGTISFIFMAQDNYNTAVKKSTELVGNKGKEQITAIQLEETKLQIANDGPATSRIIGLVSADDSSGSLNLKPLNLALPSSQKLDYTIPDGISGSLSGKTGLLTSLGNIFWVDSKPLQNKPLPDFAIAIAPDSLTVEQGKTGTASITVSPLNGFSNAVFLSAAGLPQGASYLIKPSSGNLLYTSTLTVQVGSTTPVGVYTITITGDDKNGRVHSATLTLQVNAASNQDFMLSLSSKTVTVQQGSSATNSVTVSPVYGYDRTVTLETSGFPTGVTYSYNPLSAKPQFTSTLTIGSAANTPAGTYVITVKGSDDTGKVHSDTFTLQITAQPDFDLSVNPSSLNLQSGSSGSSVVSITSLNGYSGQVILSLSGLPSGATASFSKPSGNPSFASILDINAGTANPGAYNLIVTGTGSTDGKTKSTQLTLAIQQETFIDFSLALSSGNINVQQGGSGSNTVTISPINGYNKIVSLSASGIPSGVSASFSPQSGVPAFTSTMSISASTSAAPGSYSVIVEAQGQDGKVHSTTFTLKVQAKYKLTISVQTAGPSVAPTTFISDTFSTGLDGWSYWGDGGYALTHDTGTGSPAPSAKISGDAFATVHGMQKVVDLSSWSKAGTLTLSFNYRAASDYAGSTVTNAFVRIYNADTSQILYEETLVAGGTQDTGWKSYSKDITCSVLSAGSTINKIRIVLFLGDGWIANWNQKNWYDNIKLESSASGASCGGTTSPAPGTYTYDEGESVQVTALPNAGWKLSYWTLDGVSIGSQNPASVTMNKDHELAAVFAQGQSGSDFVVSANPSSLSIAKGSSGSTTIAVNSINGYSTGVSLSLSGLPSGATYSFLPWSSNAPFTSTLAINAGTANVGTYALSVTGSGLADGKVRTTTITLTITPQFDFSLSLNPSSGTVQQGGSVQTTVTTTLLSGTSSPVSLSASGGPFGTTFTFGPASGNPTFASTLTISIPSNAATGTYQVTVAGSGGGGVSRTATYQLTVSPQTQQTFNYALSVSPSSLSIAKGSSAQTTVSVDLLAGSSAQAVVLSSTGQPSGVTVSFKPSSGNPTFKSTMSISVSSAANAGIYTLTITGTSGALAKSTTLTLTIVNAADFTLSAIPSTLSVQQGSSGSAVIKVDALSGYSNTVSLSATGLPSGVTYAFSPSSGKPTFSSTLTLSASQSAATGTFTVTISGIGTDGKTRTTTLALTIPKQTNYQLAVAVKDQFNAPVKGITVTVDSSSYTTDTNGQVAIQVSQGTHTIAVPSSYLQSSGTRYLFEKWGDGGGVTANPRTVTVNSAVTFTAMEKKQHYLTMQISPSSSAGTVSPSSDWYDSGKQVAISASPSSSYKFDIWSGSGSGSYSGTANPATVTVNAPITETGGFQKVYTVSVKTLATYGGLSTSPLSGLKVKIGSSTVQTDSNGVASFALPAGTYDISLVDASVTKSISSVDVRSFAFKWWDNLSTSNPRTINVNGPSTLIAYYPITWQQYTLNPNTYAAEVADPSQTDSLGNPVLRSVSLPYTKSASNWWLGWEWSMDVRTDSKGAYFGAHDYAVWGYGQAFTTKWNSKFTPATHSYAVDKLAISYSGYLKVKGITSDSDQGLYFRYRDTYNNKGDTSPSVDWTNTKSYNGVVGAARVFTPKQVIVGDLMLSTYQWTRGSNFDMRFSNGYGWTTNNMIATLYFIATNP